MIQRVARELCKEFKSIVVTGSKIYYYKKNKVNSQTTMLNDLRKSLEKDSDWGVTISQIVAHLCDIGIFFIDGYRTASEHEEGIFHGDNRRKGLGVVISNKNIKKCKFCQELNHKRINYLKCNTYNFNQPS